MRPTIVDRGAGAGPGHVGDEHDAPERRDRGDTAGVRVVEGDATGSPHLEQRVLRFVPGRSRDRTPGDDRDEVLFVLSGRGVLHVDGDTEPLEPETGAFVARGERYGIDNPGPDDLRLISILADPPDGDVPIGERRVTVQLAEQQTAAATASREFRIVMDPGSGCPSVTQFVGWIPPGRAPVHYHLYDEVMYVLDGDGVMHMEGRSTPISGGSCVHLPPRLEHCVENVGDAAMRVLGVFRPAGSPAAAYLPGGEPAVQTGGGAT